MREVTRRASPGPVLHPQGAPGSCCARLAALSVAMLAPAAGADLIHVPDEMPSIQAAIAAARHGDEILVAAGTYRETIDFVGKAVTLRSLDGPGVTILDGTGIRDSVVKFVLGEGADTVLEGFRITGGTGSPDLYGLDATVGGGLLALGSSPTILDCIFGDNVAGFHGGGMFSGADSMPLLRNCLFEGNFAEKGGGLFSAESRPRIVSTRFVANAAAYGGGAIASSRSPGIELVDCRFTRNFASYNGGGIYDYAGDPMIVRCTFTRNMAAYKGGAIYHAYRSTSSIQDCTFLTPNDDIAGSGGFSIRQDRARGACCLGRECLVIERLDCLAAGGIFVGPGSTCEDPGACPTPAPTDLNGDGVVDALDLMLLMGDWGRGPDA